jgi:squalene cyclase
MEKLRKDPIPYLMSNASAVSKLKFLAVLGESESGESLKIIGKMRNAQNSEGSWGKPALVNGTAYVLYVLLEAGESKNSKIAMDAANWLFRRQRLDSAWTENVEPPKFVQGIVLVDRDCTWITGNVVQVLIKAGFKKDPRVKGAVDYLKSTQNSDGGWPPWRGGESTLSIMDYIIKAFIDYGEAKNSSYINAALKYVLSRSLQWTPFEASAVLPILLSVGYKQTDNAVRTCLMVLTKTQNEDGGWTYPEKTRGSDPELTAHIAYWLARCGYSFKLPHSN